MTRGTTARGRLRRVDRWLLATRPGLVRTPGLVVVDVGFGARPVTTLDLAARLARVNPTATVVGLDIDPQRVEAAGRGPLPRNVRLAVGGFELAGHRPHVVRAMNVLRQYDAAEAATAWATMGARLAPGGLLVEGTCDEAGRVGSWVALAAGGPHSLTLAVDVSRPPEVVAARLPKALIHRNVDGEAVHRLLADLAHAWRCASGLGAFGPRHRFASAVGALRTAGWPLLDGPRRWRRGELTVAWEAVAPVAR